MNGTDNDTAYKNNENTFLNNALLLLYITDKMVNRIVIKQYP